VQDHPAAQYAADDGIDAGTVTAPQLPSLFGAIQPITDTKKPAKLSPCGLSGLR